MPVISGLHRAICKVRSPAQEPEHLTGRAQSFPPTPPPYLSFLVLARGGRSVGGGGGRCLYSGFAYVGSHDVHIPPLYIVEFEISLQEKG